MTSLSENASRQRLAIGLMILGCLFVFLFWAGELYRALAARDQHAEDLIKGHQEIELERKGEELRDLFNELYTNTRTISLLPMIRSAEGRNRSSPTEDVVASGRFSIDAHHTLQQIYTNLNTHLQLSEIYYVLDGFDPRQGDVPFLMYDDVIAGRGTTDSPETDANLPAEVEDFEYEYFPKQLKWFRDNAPQFSFSKQLDDIPIRLSPLMRTCDNTQFLSEKHGNVADAEGLIYAIPVYSPDGKRFRGMVTTIIRRNVLEARLIGVPFLPLTPADKGQMKNEGWTLPKESSSFLLRNPEYGIDIYDRRSDMMSSGVASGFSFSEGRWIKKTLNLRTGMPWELHYFMPPAEINELISSVTLEKREIIISRVALLILLVAVFLWVAWLLRRGRRELMWMAHYDSLTELPNRRAFFERLAAAMVRVKRNQSRAGVFFIDIAGFGAINDTLGQQVGDQLLSAVGQRLVESVRGSDVVTRIPMIQRPSDSVARLGGDEFTILCEDLSSGDDLAVVAERILDGIRSPIIIDGNEIEVSVYIGIAACPDDASDGEELLMAAESAMQQCRTSGPGYLLYNEDMRKRAARQHQLSIDLNLALERRQFELFYQPKAALSDGSIVSLEALLRWKHAELGMISPVEFIPLLERSGRIVEVGEWVLVQSCRDIQTLSDLGYGDMRVSANVSVRQLRRGNFHETVARVLRETSTDPARLILEITESMVMENLQEGQLALERLKALGVRLAIDDFGTGYSSLTYLQFLPLDYLKLDKSFIDGMTSDHARHIVKTVIALAQGLQLTTIAEGIETETQRDELRSLGCDMIQGYLLSKPKPLSEIVQWLAKPTH